jgi:hypothetical protein
VARRDAASGDVSSGFNAESSDSTGSPSVLASAGASVAESSALFNVSGFWASNSAESASVRDGKGEDEAEAETGSVAGDSATAALAVSVVCGSSGMKKAPSSGQSG